MPHGQLAQVLRALESTRTSGCSSDPRPSTTRASSCWGRPRVCPRESSSRWCRRSTSSRRWSTTPASTARSRRPTRSRTSTRWAARPLSALTLAGFPKDFPSEWIGEIFRGGFDKVREAGRGASPAATRSSREAQFGFAVTGVVDRERVTANAGARAGDVALPDQAARHGHADDGGQARARSTGRRCARRRGRWRR